MSTIIRFIIMYMIGGFIGRIIGGAIFMYFIFHLSFYGVWPGQEPLPIEDPPPVTVGLNGFVSPIMVFKQKNDITKDFCKDLKDIGGKYKWNRRTEVCEKWGNLPMGKKVNLPEGTVLTVEQYSSLYNL